MLAIEKAACKAAHIKCRYVELGMKEAKVKRRYAALVSAAQDEGLAVPNLRDHPAYKGVLSYYEL